MRLIPQASLQHTVHTRIRSAVVLTAMGKISLVLLCLVVSVFMICTDQGAEAAAPLPRYGRREEVKGKKLAVLLAVT